MVYTFGTVTLFFILKFVKRYLTFTVIFAGTYIWRRRYAFLAISRLQLSDLSNCLFFMLSVPLSVPKLLVDLHVKLLRKIGKSVSADRWEKYLVKVNVHISTYHGLKCCWWLIQNMLCAGGYL